MSVINPLTSLEKKSNTCISENVEPFLNLQSLSHTQCSFRRAGETCNGRNMVNVRQKWVYIYGGTQNTHFSKHKISV